MGHSQGRIRPIADIPKSRQQAMRVSLRTIDNDTTVSISNHRRGPKGGCGMILQWIIVPPATLRTLIEALEQAEAQLFPQEHSND